MIFQVVDPVKLQYEHRELPTGQILHVPHCVRKNLAYEYALYAYEGLILVLCTKLCYDTRHVPDVLNESPHIASVITTIVLVCTVAFPLVYVGNMDPYLNQLVIGIGFFISIMSFLVSYFGPKCLFLISGKFVSTCTTASHLFC
jgi:hypothetical protein